MQVGDSGRGSCYAAAVERYFFDLSECGTVCVDEEGVELASLAAAHDRAVLAARDLMCGEVRHGRLCLGCRIDVRDADGHQVLVLPFSDAVTVTGLH